jgi:2-polyprenyl-6-methoxyphenol hydroxylase-like FAD-dependent oxidoreductase
MDADVVVAGGGPVGLMLAGELRLHGVDVIVLERLPTPSDKSRAQALHGRTIPTLDHRGLLGRFLAEERRLNGGGGKSHEKRALPRPHFAGIYGLPRLEPDGDVPLAVFVPQVVTTGLIATWAAELGADIRRGSDVEGFTQDDDGVTVRLSTGDSLRARFVVGCDGAHSVIRASADVAFTGTGATMTTLAGEVRLGDPGNVPVGWQRTPRGCTVISPHPAGGASRVVALDFAGPPADRDAPVTLDELAAVVSRIHDRYIPMADLRAGARYGDAARQAEQYRQGRAFLAGDSAHVHYPVGGQGLNLGIQDAVNLGWKLAAVLKGWAPQGLLDTYHTERHPVAASVLRHTRAQVALLNPHNVIDPVRELFAELLSLNEVGEHLATKMFAADVRYELGGSHLLAGGFAPNLKLEQTRLAELLHAGRPVFADLTGLAAARALAGRWSDRVDVVTTHCVDRPDVGGLLIRPDGYLAWACPPGEADLMELETVLRRWFGDPTDR